MTSTLWPVSFEVFPLKKQTARGVFKTAKSALSTETELELEAAKVQKASTSRLPNKQEEKSSITHLSPSQYFKRWLLVCALPCAQSDLVNIIHI